MLRKCAILAAMLAMLLLAAPVAYASWPDSAVCEEEVERMGGHAPGEFLVSYESVEAMWAAPQENVKRTSNDWGWYETDTGTVYYPIPNGRQLLYFEDIASIPDLEERLSAEEAKRQEILTWPGVQYAGFNILGCAQ
jgi:hypothetical protein